MSQPGHNPDREDSPVEFVGAPTEYAEAQEVPIWMANLARLLFFLPAAYVTAVTVPVILIGLCLLCVLAVVVLAALL